MRIIHRHGDEKLAVVYAAQFRDDKRYLAEFVSAKDPSKPLTEKWVIIVSTQFGCPVKCPICDAGDKFYGNLTAGEILEQIDHVIAQEKIKPSECKKFKVQLARMGEPAFNPAVLEVLKILPERYRSKKIIPCIATIAPKGNDEWFEQLIEIKKNHYPDEFQLQFSVHSTNKNQRDKLIPFPKWNLEEIAGYGEKFINKDNRKASLNFAVTKDAIIDCAVISNNFNPQKFCVKITPVNPTYSALENKLANHLIDEEEQKVDLIQRELSSHGFDVIVSIGDLRENEIGSNCGMVVRRVVL